MMEAENWGQEFNSPSPRRCGREQKGSTEGNVYSYTRKNWRRKFDVFLSLSLFGSRNPKLVFHLLFFYFESHAMPQMIALFFHLLLLLESPKFPSSFSLSTLLFQDCTRVESGGIRPLLRLRIPKRLEGVVSSCCTDQNMHQELKQRHF